MWHPNPQRGGRLGRDQQCVVPPSLSRRVPVDHNPSADRPSTRQWFLDSRADPHSSLSGVCCRSWNA